MSRASRFTFVVAALIVAEALSQQAATPLVKLLPRFAAPGVPAVGPAEIEAAPLPPVATAPGGLPHRGPSQHPHESTPCLPGCPHYRWGEICEREAGECPRDPDQHRD